MEIESIHGKELLNLRTVFAFSREVHPDDDAYAGHLKDVAQKHFGANPDTFTNLSDEQVVKALHSADSHRDKSRWNAQTGTISSLVGIGILSTGVAPAFALYLSLAGLWQLYKARSYEQDSHETMKNGLQKLGVNVAPLGETASVPIKPKRNPELNHP